MKQIGIVEAVNGTEARVKIKRESACGGNCASCGGCGGAKTTTVVAQNKAVAVVGDMVELEMPSGTVLSAAAAVYIIPLVAFIVGDVLANNIFKSELKSLLGGLAFMAAAYGAVILKSKKNKDKYILVIEKIINM